MLKLFSRQHDMTNGNIYKSLIFFAIPILLGNLFQQLYSTADAIMVGQFAGEEAFAAIDSVFNLTKLPMQIFIGIASAGSILISKCFGAKDNEGIMEYGRCMMLLAIVSGILMSIFMIVALPFFLRMLNIPQGIYEITYQYTKIFFVGMTFAILFSLCTGIYQAIGNSGKPFLFLLISNLLNLLLDYIFLKIFSLGAGGAATATVIAQGIACFLMIFDLSRYLTKNQELNQTALISYKVNKAKLIEILSIGLPIGIQSAIYPIANMAVQSKINSFGTVSIAAWAVAGKLDFLIWLFISSMEVATTTFIAQNIGANRNHRIKKGMFVSLSFTVFIIGLLSLILFFQSETLSKIFVKNTEVINLTKQMIYLIGLAYPISAIGGLCSAAIKGTGQTFYPMAISMFTTCVLRVSWVNLIYHYYPTIFAILFGYPLTWSINAIIIAIYAKIHISSFLKKSMEVKTK